MTRCGSVIWTRLQLVEVPDLLATSEIVPLLCQGCFASPLRSVLAVANRAGATPPGHVFVEERLTRGIPSRPACRA